jgi:hypothetical protein
MDINYAMLLAKEVVMPRPKTEAAEYYQTTLRVPPDVFALLRAEAREIGRPINTHLVRILESYCAKTGKKAIPSLAPSTP